MKLEPWQKEWQAGSMAWEMEMDGQRGLFQSLCLMDAMDLDYATAMAWIREHGELFL